MNTSTESITWEWWAKTILVVGLFLYSGGGFHGYKDIDKRFFVVSMGVDAGKESLPYDVTLKLAIPQGDPKSGEEDFVILTRSAASIGEAVAFMKSQVDKELDFGHMKAIVIGEELAKQELEPVLDWFFRRRDIQKIGYVSIARPDALTILELKPKSERIPGNVIFQSFGSDGTETPYIMTEYVFDLHRRLHERGIDPVLPIIEEMKKEKLMNINTSYVVGNQGTKLELNPKETALISLLLNRTSRATLTGGSEGKTFAVTADDIGMKYELSSGERPKASFRGTVTGILEGASAESDFSKLLDYERALEQSLEADVVELLRKLRDASVDPIGFGLHYRATSFRNETEWERWKQLYPKLDFSAEIDVKLETTGTIE
ncbi:Ger(x)C family spore germination protein [Paenibacillus sp. TRM 82003]|nr:Ger(x)C family spore germination protein [Paenibacillus sp. TRM 82003]